MEVSLRGSIAWSKSNFRFSRSYHVKKAAIGRSLPNTIQTFLKYGANLDQTCDYMMNYDPFIDYQSAEPRPKSIQGKALSSTFYYTTLLHVPASSVFRRCFGTCENKHSTATTDEVVDQFWVWDSMAGTLEIRKDNRRGGVTIRPCKLSQEQIHSLFTKDPSDPTRIRRPSAPQGPAYELWQLIKSQEEAVKEQEQRNLSDVEW